MPVFISYRHTDRAQAMAINARLKLANIKTYLDVLDTESQQTDDITAVITRNITECTHLLAVVSQETAMSWWVPFEIGEATISDRRICSYKIGPSALPLYLDKWPKLSGDTDLDFFIDAYRKEAMLERSTGIESFSESIRGTFKRNADLFHDQLKDRIRRGY
ncbi:MULTISPECIES: toll/interleukin-1 receptor domain-containing protein [Pseudomonas]|uniref:Toll/interleukin-1 receptor domain-containing protein n=1 Tax=Pseudomonas wuhanensis TaxID=2954098 RepID=A0ABY9GQB7_9PSED|nr:MULTISPECIES: toll/interleukin-1 receptor domain-containing protein [unclassified Pseudomonas]WLI12135.1 toll/interleukin-1 receptor domain-containing protein [Pseudomonas sp. FP603]WLI17986.1 toll/interleukin-1 receptor domain-containing protein [Pseudomonas sp. FP607]